jgi:hypothetical protein
MLEAIFAGRGGGAYRDMAAALLDYGLSAWPHLRAPQIALAGPVWFCRRVAAEIGAEPVRRPGGLEVCSLDGWPVVGAGALEHERTGSFLLQDVIAGCAYQLPVFCHERLDPPDWYPLTLAIRAGLNPAAAYDVAGLRTLPGLAPRGFGGCRRSPPGAGETPRT